MKKLKISVTIWMLLSLMMLSACSEREVIVQTDIVIPPEHLVIPVVYPKLDVPKGIKLINLNVIQYIQMLEKELDVQNNNYVEFNKWRDDLIKEKKRLQEN